MKDNITLTPHELVTLRFLEQGRGTISDGLDWLRMVYGVVATVVINCTVAALCYKFTPAYVPWLTIVTGISGVLLTVMWIMLAGEKVRACEISRLRGKTTEL